MRFSMLLLGTGLCVFPLVLQASDVDLMKLVSEASVEAQKSLKSLHATGTFQVHRRTEGEENEELWTDGQFKMWFQKGKMCLDLSFDKKLVNVRLLRPEGAIIEKVADASPDRVLILVDEFETLLVTFNTRIRPTGCKIESFAPERSSAAFALAGFPIREPVFPQDQLIDFKALVNNLGAEAIEIAEKDGMIEGQYRIKNSKTAYVDFQLNPEDGYHLSEKKIYNSPNSEPVRTRQLEWSQQDSIWYVSTLHELFRRSSKDEAIFWERTKVTYDTYLPNKPIDESVFKLSHYEIPPGTRTTTR